MAGIIEVGNRRLSKAEMVAEVANDLIAEIVERARRSDSLRDYYDIAVVGYSGDGVHPLLGDKWMLPITQIDAMNTETITIERESTLPNGESRFFSHNVRRWITPAACGSTPMYEALLTVNELVEQWTLQAENIESFPPQIFNITDGESSDCDYIDMAEIAGKIKSHSTRDGAALLYNIHIASSTNQESIIFPSRTDLDAWHDKEVAALSLYNSASDLPPIFEQAISQIKGDREPQGYKAMSYNTSMAQLITILNIGSISIKRG